MNKPESTDQPLTNFRELHEDTRAGRSEFDARALIGVTGEQLHPTELELQPSGIWNITAKERMRIGTEDTLSGAEEDDVKVVQSERVLGLLATRKAQDFIRPLFRKVASMREPMRTVATQCLLNDKDPTEVARLLELSIETVDWLAQTALDSLADLVIIQPPPHAYTLPWIPDAGDLHHHDDGSGIPLHD
jgi:hypothetical protein